MPRSAARAHPRILVTVLCLGVTFAHAQQLRSIESQPYVTCVQSAFERRLDDFGVSSLPQATDQASATEVDAAACASFDSGDRLCASRAYLVLFFCRHLGERCQHFRLQISLELFDRGADQDHSLRIAGC